MPSLQWEQFSDMNEDFVYILNLKQKWEQKNIETRKSAAHLRKSQGIIYQLKDNNQNNKDEDSRPDNSCKECQSIISVL